MNDNEDIITNPPQDEPKKPAPNADGLDEFRDSEGNFDAEKIKKLAEDKKYYRQQISKLRQVPQKIEEYGKDFVLDSKFDEFVSDEKNKERIDKVFEKLDKLSLEKGLGVDRNNDIRRFVLDELVDSGVIDLTSKAEKEAKLAKIVSERNDTVKKTIGETTDVEAWNGALLTWLKDFCNSEAEYKMHENLVKTNAIWALSINKMRHAMMGNRIPVAVSDPKYNEAEWNRQFRKADRETQDRMLEERAKELTKNK